MSGQLNRGLLAGSAATLFAAGLAVPALPADAATVVAATATEPVIVVLADQLSSTPPAKTGLSLRASRAHVSQHNVLSRLTGRKPTNVKYFSLANAFAATVTPAQAQALAADPAVASVTPDRAVPVGPAVQATPAQPHAAPVAPSHPASVDPNACSADAKHPVLEPEALSTINARSDSPTAKTAASLGIDGSGVKVAFIADGLNPDNVGFRRADGSSSIVDYKDFYGTGPNAPTGGGEAFGDASAISAQGAVYDVAAFANPSVVNFDRTGGHCYIRILGVAPGANVVALKAGSELLPNSAILQAIDYAVSTAHVDVLNESFGANLYPDSSARNTIQLFDDLAVKAGVTVTVSTGDAGTTGTIGNPSTDPNLISTGASTDARIYEQTGYALATAFGNGRWLDDNISSLSSAGITQNGRTIDVSAPGEADWAVCDASGRFSNCTSFHGTFAPIQSFGGTSQAAPITAGVAALVIQAYRQAHHGVSPAPAVVKQIITSTAHDLGFSGEVQGTGRVDARAAVEEALSWKGSSRTASLPSNLALSTDQLPLSGSPGRTRTGRVRVTNIGTSPLTVLPSTRRYASLGAATQTVAVGPTGTTTAYPTNGAPWAYRTVTFTVPAGTDVLDSTIRWQSGAGPAQAGPVVRLSLFAPDGTYAANTRPQGGTLPANYGDVLVQHPDPGTWTAVLYTPVTGGFTGNVYLRTDPQRAIPDGRVRPSLFTVKPGASRTVRISEIVPTTGGDGVSTLALAASNGRQVAVPVIVRPVIPTSPESVGRFAGTISGGNARAYSPAQTFSYEFDVPRGMRDLDVSVTLADDPADLLEGVLVDPHGETPSISTNAMVTGPQVRSMQNTVANPLPGRWRYVVVVQNPVSGMAFFQGFSGQVAFNKVGVTASLGSPRSISAGLTRTFAVTVTNPGPAPIALQADPRTIGTDQVQLAPQFAGSTISLPLSVENLTSLPAYLVPPDTSRISLSAASTVPAQVELSSPGSGIDVFGDLQQAKSGSTISTAMVRESSGHVAQGLWTTYVQEIGPFGDAGAPAGRSTLVANAVTAGFDRTVSTSVGDPYLSSVDPTASPGTPVIVQPGETAAITVTIAPRPATTGAVRGVLNLVTTPIGTPLFNTTGDILAAIPYSYRAR